MPHEKRAHPCCEEDEDVRGEYLKGDRHGKVEFEWTAYLNRCAIDFCIEFLSIWKNKASDSVSDCITPESNKKCS